jgi:hypothetical protein
MSEAQQVNIIKTKISTLFSSNTTELLRMVEMRNGRCAKCKTSMRSIESIMKPKAKRNKKLFVMIWVRNFMVSLFSTDLGSRG